jgi:DNA primase
MELSKEEKLISKYGSLDNLKSKIKNDIPTSLVIGQYLIIKHSGISLMALCPFHSESKPSMFISDDKKIFKCFSCEAAGDAISFVMKYRNLDLIDALEEISKKVIMR